jgi:hypothetical protein
MGGRTTVIAIVVEAYVGRDSNWRGDSGLWTLESGLIAGKLAAQLLAAVAGWR